jgi:hypothetical protein
MKSHEKQSFTLWVLGHVGTLGSKHFPTFDAMPKESKKNRTDIPI